MKFNILLIYIIFFENIAYPQLFPYLFYGMEEKAIERKIYVDSNSHASVKPWLIHFNDWQQIDSTRSIVKNKNITAFVKPLLNLETNQNFNQFYQIGTAAFSSFGKKISIYLSLSQCVIGPDSIQKKNYDSIGLWPQWGYVKKNGSVWLHTHYEGGVFWQALPYLSFRTGISRHFLGDGYRSLFLSENTALYPYIQGIAKIWKVEYLVLYSFLNEPQWHYFDQVYERKNSTLHYLSWNINKRFNINAFETVIWQVYDSIGYRGFDINYINPFIFFRPIEFSLGSPDNVIMGMGFRYRFFENSHLYGQFLLDEFKLSEWKTKNGWWGNKFGFQLGVKTYKLFNSSRWFALLECNTVRPFTYTHSDYLNNWGHMHQPMAHPLGANFIEWVFQLAYNTRVWTFSLQLFYQRQGRSNNTYNAGENIYWSYNQNRQEYGYHLLSGTNENLKQMNFRISYEVSRRLHLKGYIQTAIIHQIFNTFDSHTHLYFNVGFAQNIYNYR